ncbi:MAG: type II toxin-antitoxin system RelE/ParE family toxin [Bauldia sp.]|nr:type II toxin-antitoxin system RelE/ParE family toxin [Bauldia sp.]
MPVRELTFSREALKSLRRMPENVASTIRSKLVQYTRDPSALGNNVKALKGQVRLLRLRVGDWRVVFTDDGRVVAVSRIAPRGKRL